MAPGGFRSTCCRGRSAIPKAPIAGGFSHSSFSAPFSFSSTPHRMPVRSTKSAAQAVRRGWSAPALPFPRSGVKGGLRRAGCAFGNPAKRTLDATLRRIRWSMAVDAAFERLQTWTAQLRSSNRNGWVTLVTRGGQLASAPRRDPNRAHHREAKRHPQIVRKNRNSKRCFSGPWPGSVGHLRLVGQRSESAAAR